ncbi:MAG: hypothetical protein WD355_05185 [Balneolaceae bacterium]
MNNLSRLILTIGIFSLAISPLIAQGSEYQAANRLMQEQKYEEALPILEQLYNEHPDAGIFFDRYLDCLVEMKEFDRAIQAARLQISEGRADFRAEIRIAELHHLRGEEEEAYRIWDEMVENENSSLQLFYTLGNSMTGRREFARAASLYSTARERFGDTTLFTHELANAELQAGNFSAAIHEYISLVRNNPEQINFVQQRLLQMNDNQLYSIAAVELEDHLFEMETDHAAYHSLNQLVTWLLIETGEYRRALVAARQYESSTTILNYSLYSVAGQLLSNRQFELSAEAYRYYAERGSSSVRFQAMEQEADVYRRWASWLTDHNLENAGRREELYRKAYELNEFLLSEGPNYDHRARILVRQAEIALDTFYNRDEAVRWTEILERELGGLGGGSTARLYYLQGRIALYDTSYTLARQLFTRANRNAEESALAERTRYFLSLTDFFAGDYEYATLQLRSLERRNESYYANNALKLRMWIQQGSPKEEETEEEWLPDFSELMLRLIHGETHQALAAAERILNRPTHPLKADAVVELASRVDLPAVPALYSMVQSARQEFAASPLRERLLWEEARLAQVLLDAGGYASFLAAVRTHHDPEEIPDSPAVDDAIWPQSASEVESLYEQLLQEFPQGFYAPYARQALQTINEPGS